MIKKHLLPALLDLPVADGGGGGGLDDGDYIYCRPEHSNERSTIWRA